MGKEEVQVRGSEWNGKKVSLASITTKAGKYLSKNAPAILTGLGLTSIVATAFFAHKAALKADSVIRKAEENTLLTPKEKFKLVWKHYLPPVLSCGAAIGFIVAANSVHIKRQAALVTVATLGERALSEYKAEVAELVGKNKARKAEDNLVQKKVTAAETEGKFDKIVLAPDSQRQYVYETTSGHIFQASIEELHKAENEIGRQCLDDDFATLNDFLGKVGASAGDIGDEIGWNNRKPIELNLGSAIVRDGKGLIAIKYTNPPSADFRTVW